MMRKILLFLALMPLTACATMFNGTEQGVRIIFFDSATGAQIPNEKIKVHQGEEVLTANEDLTYMLKRNQIEYLQFMGDGYVTRSKRVTARISALYRLNYLWELPVMIGMSFGGFVLAGQVGEVIGMLGGAVIGTGVSAGVDLGAGGAYVYPDEIKIFLDKK